MFSEIASQHFHLITHRLVSFLDLARYSTAELGLDTADAEEVALFLRGRHVAIDAESVIDHVFEPKPHILAKKTRFSDGTIRVYYSALELETAEAEISYWYAKEAAIENASTIAYYRSLRCDFSGMATDLRPHFAAMPFLIADDGYDECNKIARAAILASLDGLITPSARRQGGACLPVFSRGVLSKPAFGSDIQITLGPSSAASTA